ncbi:hypothetical protein Goari_024754 [Gossypium aridum]|uniref:AIG1-type G domain-containing protein n=1 Tax=Gossypium aridum TaxID=34290 RepID=A0A7J8X733_GOSAI|nr:hypothetical protein [Gossypium aridum]
MVIGKTGAGKSATINSIFDEIKFGTDAFQIGTKKVQDVVGMVHGIKVRVIDTPGLLPSRSDQRQNERILLEVKCFVKKTPPDILLYIDRLDMQTGDIDDDRPVLRTVTKTFGPPIWFNAIMVLTHAAYAPPDGLNGNASSYDMFVAQRSHVVQQAIRQAAGVMHLMNPVSLAENHSACRTNRAGQRVLPNGQVWKPHLPQVKLPDENSCNDDLDESLDSEDESEYDELPPFVRLTKAQLAKLTKAQKKTYFDELEYREKFFYEKQFKDEKTSTGASSAPVPMPDLPLPASFNSNNQTHRYRYLDSTNPWLVRPVLDTHGWDHDVGYEGINVERSFMVKHKYPVSFSGQITKDKKNTNIQTELASSLKHGSAGLKVEDKVIVNKRFCVVMTGNAMTAHGYIAYGGSLEAQWKDKDFLLNNSLSTLGVSIMDWDGDHVIGCNGQSHVRIGRSTNVIAQADLNNRGTGQVSIRISSSEQIQLALVALFPLMKKLIGYPQRMLYGPL